MTFQVFYKGPNGIEGCATWPSTAAIAQAHAETLERNGYDAEVVILDAPVANPWMAVAA
jgi:hypothetical protein